MCKGESPSMFFCFLFLLHLHTALHLTAPYFCVRCVVGVNATLHTPQPKQQQVNNNQRSLLFCFSFP